MRIYTIGHSTTDFEKFCNILKHFEIQKLIDVRSYPGSRYVPKFNKENLEIELPLRQIDYMHFSQLGGRRKSSAQFECFVGGWKNASFKNYAAYTLTDKYEEGIAELLKIAQNKTVCIMCAESVPWKCHRLLISNTLTIKGVEVFHIMDENQLLLHELNKYGAKSLNSNGKVIYPK